MIATDCWPCSCAVVVSVCLFAKGGPDRTESVCMPGDGCDRSGEDDRAEPASRQRLGLFDWDEIAWKLNRGRMNAGGLPPPRRPPQRTAGTLPRPRQAGRCAPRSPRAACSGLARRSHRADGPCAGRSGTGASGRDAAGSGAAARVGEDSAGCVQCVLSCVFCDFGEESFWEKAQFGNTAERPRSHVWGSALFIQQSTCAGSIGRERTLARRASRLL